MKKGNNKGSTLITGVIVVMILLIITGTVFSIAYSYQLRSLNEYTRKQAYLNAVGVADVVAKQINEGGTNSDRLVPDDLGASVDIVSVQLPEGTNGKVTGVVRMDNTDENLIYIQITSTVNKQTERVQLTMKKKYNKWYKYAYSEFEENAG